VPLPDPGGPKSIKLVMFVAFRLLKKYPYQRILRACKVRESPRFYEKSDIFFKNKYLILKTTSNKKQFIDLFKN
jgi:hypothetical protein